MRRHLLLLSVLLFVGGVAPRYMRGQEFASPIRVGSMPGGGSLVTIQKPINIDLRGLETQNISDIHLRTVIPNLGPDARVVEFKPAGQPEKSRILVRESPSTWYLAPEAPPIAQPSMQPPPQPSVLWLATTLGGKRKLLTQLVPPDSGENSWGWPEQGPFAINPEENTDALRGLLDTNPQLVTINNRGRLFPKDWVELVKNSGRPYIIVTPESPNHGFLGIASAAKLGGKTLRPETVHVLSALPKLDSWVPFTGYWELRRMDISHEHKDVWVKVSSDIKNANLPVKINDATSTTTLSMFSRATAPQGPTTRGTGAEHPNQDQLQASSHLRQSWNRSFFYGVASPGAGNHRRGRPA